MNTRCHRRFLAMICFGLWPSYAGCHGSSPEPLTDEVAMGVHVGPNNYPIASGGQWTLQSKARWIYDTIHVKYAWRRGVTGAGQWLLVFGHDFDFRLPGRSAQSPGTSSNIQSNSFLISCLPPSMSQWLPPWLGQAQYPHDTAVAAIAAASDQGAVSVYPEEFAGLAYNAKITYGAINMSQLVGGLPVCGVLQGAMVAMALAQLSSAGGPYIMGTGIPLSLDFSLPSHQEQAHSVNQGVAQAVSHGHVVVAPGEIFSTHPSAINDAMLAELDGSGGIVLGTVVPDGYYLCDPADPANCQFPGQTYPSVPKPYITVYAKVPYGQYSLAAPTVMGTIALMREANPSLTPAGIKSLLRTHFGSPSTPLDADKAVELAMCGAANRCYLSGSGRARLDPEGSPPSCAYPGDARAGLDGLGCFQCMGGAWTSCASGIAACNASNACYLAGSNKATIDSSADQDSNPDDDPFGCAIEGSTVPSFYNGTCRRCTGGAWNSCSSGVEVCGAGNQCYVTASGAATLSGTGAGCATETTSLKGMDGLGCYLCKNGSWGSCMPGAIACGGTSTCYMTSSGRATLGPDGDPSHDPAGCAAPTKSLPGLDGLGCFVCTAGAWASCPSSYIACGSTSQCYATAAGRATLGPNGNPAQDPVGCVTNDTTLPGLDGLGCYQCSSGTWTVCPPPPSGPIVQGFDAIPSWSSVEDAPWGNAASWTISGGGQSGNHLKAARTAPGSSAKVKVYNISPNRNYTVSIYMKGTSASASYWSEAAYQLGNHSASSFDTSPGSWTMINKFSNTGTNGNGNVWIQYSRTFYSGSYSQVSIGFKSGNLDGLAPAANWDTLQIY